MRGMRLFQTTYTGADGQQKVAPKWYLEFRDHLHTTRRLAAFADKQQSEELGERIHKLIICKSSGKSPDQGTYDWIRSISPKLRDKLYKLGILGKAFSGDATDPCTDIKKLNRNRHDCIYCNIACSNQDGKLRSGNRIHWRCHFDLIFELLQMIEPLSDYQIGLANDCGFNISPSRPSP